MEFEPDDAGNRESQLLEGTYNQFIKQIIRLFKPYVFKLLIISKV